MRTLKKNVGNSLMIYYIIYIIYTWHTKLNHQVLGYSITESVVEYWDDFAPKKNPVFTFTLSYFFVISCTMRHECHVALRSLSSQKDLAVGCCPFPWGVLSSLVQMGSTSPIPYIHQYFYRDNTSSFKILWEEKRRST